MKVVSPLLLLCLMFCGPLFADSPRLNLLILGDSLSAGYGIARDASWPTLLQQKLPPQYRVVNASISGETTDGGLQRLPELLAREKPAVVVIELGANDGLRGFPVKRIRQNLTALSQLSKAAGSEVLLLGNHLPPNYGRRYSKMFHDSFDLVAQQQQVALLPFMLQGIATEPTLMQADGLHPTAEAQPQILQNVLPALEALLDERLLMQDKQ